MDENPFAKLVEALTPTIGRDRAEELLENYIVERNRPKPKSQRPKPGM